MFRKNSLTRPFNVRKHFETLGVRRKITAYCKGQFIYSQGDASDSTFYLQQGAVKIAVTSAAGKEAVIALLHPGDFFGEGGISGQPLRLSTAIAVEPITVIEIEKSEMLRMIHEEHDFSEYLLSYMIRRNAQIEEDLIDQLFNSSEKRLARALLMLAKYGKYEPPDRIVGKISQSLLAEIVGTTRGRVNFFMKKFQRLGFIGYNGGLRINDSLSRVLTGD